MCRFSQEQVSMCPCYLVSCQPRLAFGSGKKYRSPYSRVYVPLHTTCMANFLEFILNTITGSKLGHNRILVYKAL